MTTTSNGLLSGFRGAVELYDRTLGRILARQSTLGTFREVLKIPVEGISADDLAPRFFAKVARSVPAEVPVTREAYDAGAPIEASAFAALSSDALDTLVGAYLATEAGRMISRPPNGTAATDTLPGERQ